MTVLSEHRMGEPCWIDLISSDIPAAQAFYGALFGWEAADSGEEYGHYTVFSKNGHPVAGLASSMDGEPTNAWMTYLQVADADATQASAAAAGATVFAPAMTVGEMGRMVVLADPAGAAFGVWQPGLNRGYELAAEAGSPVWHELNTTDFDAVVPFYSSVFSWNPEVLPSDSPGFRYVTFGPGGDGNMVGGVYDAAGSLPAGAPSHWLVYLGIDDVDAAVTRVVELGGAVVRSPFDSPFGRFAHVTDPNGALFVLSSVPPID
jgi:uncharacterized protein